MTIWAIVPVKPLNLGKSRLAGVLTPQERLDLNRRLLAHTLDTLSSVSEIESVLVVSRDQAALALAREYGARTVTESGAPQLNVALARATLVAQSFSPSGILIVPADLPLITPEDVRLMLERALNPPVIVVAPDRHRQGTNALLVCPAGLIGSKERGYEFGHNSFQRHCELARRIGARLEICELSSLAVDMDLPEDLAFVSETLENYENYGIEESE
jgi:2-phospho-L-lactate guanylyltransferase